MPRLTFIAPLILFAIIAAYFAIGLTKNARILPSALIDKPVPTFDLPPLKDDKPGAATADLQGDVMLVNVFASWCVPCRAEHPLLMQLARDKTATIIGLNWKDKKADALAWLDELGDPYARIGHDPSGRSGIEWGVYGVPETYIIDQSGRIRYKHVGPMFREVLTETILPMIKELRE
ncbi:MAG: DsbE family thiol:disulfide interchange protein [Rhodospirillaceae bacterium]|jgi:cytochrome c biogenesis protein CcmG/thiol:disulfide interchange protein DsbE|nr:DsbE family thiol:disulfide interchange protein [Rhodospirillaceae bacterium]MBT5665603.1 DsbE family thiol:disulfide interchange protein [Rhodospirillaceae bacterium]MBT5809678.1 DsbE family thiol:disulfide interchange protein [Rhodospirillaceae bacterium]